MSTDESAKSAAADSAQAEQTVSLLDQIVEATNPEGSDERARAKDWVEQFARSVVTPDAVVDKNTLRTINLWISEIDKKLTEQLNLVIHHQDFQRLEGSWRGLFYLIDKTETGELLKIRLLNASKDDLLKDFEDASEFTESGLFRKVYTDEYDTFGGEPYGVLIGDYEFDRRPRDVALLEHIAGVAAAAHAPFISAASPKMFNLNNFGEIPRPRDLAKIFGTPDYAKWRSFRNSEDSRYVALTLPHTLMRLPYGEDNPVEAFTFEEDVDGKDHAKYLWGNAAYALQTRITDSFAKCGWLATIRGVEGGGLVEGLPVHTFPTDDGEIAMKCPTEIAIADSRENEFSTLGFIALLHCKNTDFAAFLGGQTCQKPAKYDTDEANSNAELSARLPYILCTSRFAHYLKAIARDRIGKYTSRDEMTSWLNRWINNYCCDSKSPDEAKAKRPLQQARVDVQDVPGRPGWYQAQVYLLPHYQLEGLTASLRLVSQLPEAKSG